MEPYRSDDTIELLPRTSRQKQKHKREAVREKPKIALTSSYATVSLAVFVQLLPILITAAIIYLTGASIYWADIGYPEQNSILNGLQFVSKFHEVAITASLTAIVLHRIRYDLLDASGVPLGFLTSAYQLGSVTYLIGGEFWGGARSAGSQRGLRRWLPLWLLLAVAFILAPVVGPASAIVMIPSLDWWYLPDPLNNTMISVFLPMSPAQIWPPTIDAKLLQSPAMLPASGGCSADTAYEDPLCPSGGFDDVSAWAANFMSRATEPNITLIDKLSGVSRYLTSNSQDQSSGWAVSSVLGLRQARDIGTFWQYLKSTDLLVPKIERPLLAPSFAGSLSMRKPVVQAHCALFKPNSTGSPVITFPTSELRSPSLNFAKSKDWRIPGDIDVSGPANGIVDFHWVDMSNYTEQVGLIGGVFVSTTPDGSTGVFPCTILSHWAPVNIWGDPKISSAVFQDSAEPITIVSSIPRANETKGSKSDSTLEPISIALPWATALNLPNRLPSELNSSINLTLLETSASNLGFLHANLSWRLDPQGGDATLPWILGTLLSMHLADGLSRVNSGFLPVLYHRGIFPDGQSGTGTVKGVIKNMDNRNIERWVGMPLDSGTRGELFADQARSTNASRNTEVVWEVRRYGYGWGFAIGVTVMLGVGFLLLHVLLALVHLVFMLGGRWGITEWCETPGEMVVLGWNSREVGDGLLGNTSAGIKDRATWKKRVKVRERERETETDREADMDSKKDGALSVTEGEPVTEVESATEERAVKEGEPAAEAQGITTSLELVLDGDASRGDEQSRPRVRKGVYYS